MAAKFIVSTTLTRSESGICPNSLEPGVYQYRPLTKFSARGLDHGGV